MDAGGRDAGEGDAHLVYDSDYPEFVVLTFSAKSFYIYLLTTSPTHIVPREDARVAFDCSTNLRSRSSHRR